MTALAVFLKILQILGVFLLCVLGLVLLLVLIVLFVPVRYLVRAEGNGGRFREVSARARVTWLLHLVRAEFAYPEPGALRVKVLWFTVLDTGAEEDEEAKRDPKKAEKKKERAEEKRRKEEKKREKAEKKDKKEKKKEDKKENTEDKNTEDKNTVDKREEKKAQRDTEEGEKNPSGDEKRLGEEAPEPEVDLGAAAPERKGRKAGSEKASESAKPDNILDFEEEKERKTGQGAESGGSEKSGKKQYTFWRLYDKIEKIFPAASFDRYSDMREALALKWRLLRRNADFYIRLLRSDDTRVLLRHLKKRVRRIWKVLFPRRIHADLEFGLGSPDLTGYAFGVYCMMARRFDRGSEVVPNFEREVLDGSVLAKGRFCLVTLAWQGLWIWFDRKFRLLRKRLERHHETMERAREKTDAKLRKIDEARKEREA